MGGHRDFPHRDEVVPEQQNTAEDAKGEKREGSRTRSSSAS